MRCPFGCCPSQAIHDAQERAELLEEAGWRFGSARVDYLRERGRGD